MTVPIESSAQQKPIGGLNIMDPKQMISHVYGQAMTMNSPAQSTVSTLRLPTPRSPLKAATRPPESPFLQFFPLIVGLISFASVLTILILCMDPTGEIRHLQFQKNMTRDVEMSEVAQDDPVLVSVVRAYHLRPIPVNFLKNRDTMHTHVVEHSDSVPTLSRAIAGFVDMRKDGFFVQSLIGQSGPLMTATWLADNLNWGGLIVEPEPRKYFALARENAMHPEVKLIEACLSPNNHPKEITLKNEVRINSVVDGEGFGFNSRVKCFPLYTLMLAINETKIDLLSLGCQGQELEILETIPFGKVTIKVISIHLDDYYENGPSSLSGSPDIHSSEDYFKQVHRFLEAKSYRLVKSLEHNYIYQLIERSIKKRINESNIIVTKINNNNQ